MPKNNALSRLSARQKSFKAAVEGQRVAIDAYNKAKQVEDDAFSALIRSNNRVDREKYLLVCEAIGQKPEKPAL